jgi:phosphohistidine phosphatase SixA
LIERERDCEPVPHDLVHVVQALKARTVQWIGHGPWLQTCVSSVCGHSLPPC